MGAKQVILYSNTKNAGAIKLYEKIGFQHVEVEQGVYKRANVKMVIDIEWLFVQQSDELVHKSRLSSVFMMN